MRLYLYTKEIEMSTPNISYEDKKQMLEDIKLFSKEEHIELFRIIKRDSIDYSENSNGIFFDVNTVGEPCFAALQEYMNFCLENRRIEEGRAKELASLTEETNKYLVEGYSSS